jgi:hypothetical protein
VATATAVEAATTARRIAMEAAAATDRSAAESACGDMRATGIAATEAYTDAPTVAVSATVSIATTIAVATIAVAATKPGAHADKDAAAKPRWSIVPVGSASVGSVVVVAIRADRRSVAVVFIYRAADANAHCDLRMRVGRREKKKDAE